MAIFVGAVHRGVEDSAPATRHTDGMLLPDRQAM
jgi:hypothetical protein